MKISSFPKTTFEFEKTPLHELEDEYVHADSHKPMASYLTIINNFNSSPMTPIVTFCCKIEFIKIINLEKDISFSKYKKKRL